MKNPETGDVLPLVQLPADNVLAMLDPVLGRLAERGLLPRKRPPAAVAKDFPAVAAGGGNRQLTSVGNRLMGWSVRESTGAAAASIELRDGTDASGALVAPIALTAGQTLTVWLGDAGVACGALYLVRVAGTVDGSVWLGEV